jgi:hypothetical protein
MVDKNVSECIHHWVIETANGSESKGKCKKCKTESIFYNSSESQDIRGGWGASMNRLRLSDNKLQGE